MQRYRAIRYLLLLILHRRPVEEHQDLIKLVDQHTHEMEVEAMAKSMADVLIEQGKVEGIEQGETRAKQAAVLKLIQFRFDDIPESITNQVVSIQDLSHLDALFEEVWDADSLDEIDFRNLDN